MTSPGCTSLLAQEIVPADRWKAEFLDVLPLYRKDTLSICFLGDIMMHGKQLENASDGAGSFDFSSYFHHIEERMTEADICVANMEFPLAGEPYTGYPAFSAPDEIAEYAARCGVDIFLTANNHIYDKGAAGAERTLDVYRNMEDAYRIGFTGASSDRSELLRNHPLFRIVKGMRVAFINFTYGTNGGRREGWPKVNYLSDRQGLEDAFDRAAREEADIVVALPHWGNEYELIHSREQEEMAIWLAEKGADAIIGTHPHVPQDICTLRNGDKEIQVAYSLGNAVSNMSAANTQLEMMVTLKAVRHWNGDYEILPLEVTYLWCSRPGGYSTGYTVIPVKEFIGRRDAWNGAWDYDKMMETYRRVKLVTGIEDQEKQR